MNDLDVDISHRRGWRLMISHPSAWTVNNEPQLRWSARQMVGRWAQRVAGIWALVGLVWAVAANLVTWLAWPDWLNWAFWAISVLSLGRALLWSGWRDGWLARP